MWNLALAARLSAGVHYLNRGASMPAFQILKPRNALYGLIFLALVLLPLPAIAQSNEAAPVGKVLRVAAGITLPAQMDPHRNSWKERAP